MPRIPLRMTSCAVIAQTWILMQLLLLCRTSHVGERPTSGVSRYLPPKLNINGSYIDIPANSTLRIKCYGSYPVAWKLPPLGDNVSLRLSVTEEKLDGLRPFKSVLELNTTDVMDLGRYTCYYNGTTDIENTGNATSVYVFVNDDYYLFQPNKQTGRLVLKVVRHGERSVVPCLPTHSGAKVQLWKDLGQDEMEEVSLAPHDVEFDPMRGFVIYYPHSYYAGHFVCNGSVPGRAYNDSSMAVVFVYLPPVDIAPNVMIQKESNFHPVLNGSFTLNCTVTVEAGVKFRMYWDYPNKNSSRINETKHYHASSVVTLQLTVRDVQKSDEGLYTCSCTDHSKKKYNKSVFVSVYDSPPHTAKPVVTVVNDTEPFVNGANSQGLGTSAARLFVTTGARVRDTALISVGAAVLGTCIIVTLFVFCKKYRAVMKEKQMELWKNALFDNGQVDMFNPDLPLCEQVELLPYDQVWEFPRGRLKLGRALGQGAFGRVVKAEAIGLGPKGQSLTVAVKMLKERADMSQRKALMAELKILIHLGRHLNIVNILGAVTKNIAKGELMVIVEYCKFGNLRHYLLRHRELFINQLNPETGKVDPDICYRPKSPTSASPGFRSACAAFAISNPVYCQQQQQRTPTLKYADLAMSATPSSHGNEFSFPVSESGSTTDGFLPESGNHAQLISGSSLRDHGDLRDAALTTCDLLCFAFQCARGMEYLASRKLIHRDLAARNVLLSEGMVIKICDFGLAKDCYKYSKYVRKEDGLLPVKWMAIESIMDRVYTTKSDVWSYGVLLWEMFSLGGSPYPGVVIDESFYKKLKNGYRMEKPDYAPDDVYEIMQSCWQAEPKERPDFSTLVTRLGDLLQAGVRDYYTALTDPSACANHLMKNNDYLAMGNNSTIPDYLDMKSDDENYLNTTQVGIQTGSQPHYAKMATTSTVPNGSAIARDGIEMMSILGHGGDTHEDDTAAAPSYTSVIGPTLQLQLPAGKRRDAPPLLLPQPGEATGDTRASDDLSEVCATPPPAYNLVVSVDGSGGGPHLDGRGVLEVEEDGH